MNKIEVLDHFGRLLITDAYDNHAALVKSDLSDLKETERFRNLFANMTSVQKAELENLAHEILTGILFDFLRIFEENPELKLTYESNGQKVDLVEASEMLKAEPSIEGGWIDRFSQFSDSNDLEV